MPVNSTHPLYQEACESWEIMEDVLAGEAAVKAKGETYLPMLAESDTEEYEKYKTRADFFEATARTHVALKGFLFRRDPEIKPEKEDDRALKPPLKAFIADATLTGKALYDVAKEVADRVCGLGRHGSVVDWSEEEKRPFVINYKTQDIINWAYMRVGGRTMLSLVMLHEMSSEYIATTDAPQSLDEYEPTYYDQWRAYKLKLDDAGRPYVTVELYRKNSSKVGQGITNTPSDIKGTGPAPGAKVDLGGDEFVKVRDFHPMRANKPLGEINFVFHGANGPDGNNVSRPPLIGMAKVNLSHYRTDADLENALHVLGVPTPWAAGFDVKGAQLRLGASVAWTTEEPTAHCGFLELSGTGLGNLTDALERKEKYMASLGARMLDKQHAAKGQTEAYETVALRQTGETASLTQISLSLTQTLTDVLAWAYWWCDNTVLSIADAENTVAYTITTDFMESVPDPAILNALMSLFISGAISFDSLFSRLQQYEVIPPERKIDEEKQLIKDGHGMILSLSNPPPAEPPGGQPADKNPPEKKPPARG